MRPSRSCLHSILCLANIINDILGKNNRFMRKFFVLFVKEAGSFSPPHFCYSRISTPATSPATNPTTPGAYNATI